MPVTILSALRDPVLFGPSFPTVETWAPWEAFLAALFGLEMTPEQLALYRACTDRVDAPTLPARETWCIVGRRGGKSRVAALLGVFLACFRDYTPFLVAGEMGTVPIIAPDRKEARTVMRYILGFFQGSQLLMKMVLRSRADAIELNNRVVIEVHTASFKTVRGYTVVGAILDEIAYLPTDESANPDREILNALRPGMLTIPGALLIGISSPYARRGVLWDTYRVHYGQPSGVLVWKAPTRTMNPLVPQEVIDTGVAADPEKAGAEYLAEFRRDLAALIPPEVVERCVQVGRKELPPIPGVSYYAFVDPSGGSQDSMTLGIAHTEGERGILDRVLERRPPFSPESVVQEFASVLKEYRCVTVTGDRYGGEWPRERFAAHGIHYAIADRNKSDIYLAFVPAITSGRVELLDHPRLVAQLSGLDRRTARGGHDSVDHAPGAHDDLANVAAGALLAATVMTGGMGFFRYLENVARAAEAREQQAEPALSPSGVVVPLPARPADDPRLALLEEQERRVRARGGR